MRIHVDYIETANLFLIQRDELYSQGISPLKGESFYDSLFDAVAAKWNNKSFVFSNYTIEPMSGKVVLRERMKAFRRFKNDWYNIRIFGVDSDLSPELTFSIFSSVSIFEKTIHKALGDGKNVDFHRLMLTNNVQLYPEDRYAMCPYEYQFTAIQKKWGFAC
jgi:hypothetical protein